MTCRNNVRNSLQMKSSNLRCFPSVNNDHQLQSLFTFDGTLISSVLCYRDDDDINDVASMAGVNLNEESARILATNSELVGTQIRSCKDEAFLHPGLLHRRILETGMRRGHTPATTANVVTSQGEHQMFASSQNSGLFYSMCQNPKLSNFRSGATF